MEDLLKSYRDSGTSVSCLNSQRLRGEACNQTQDHWFTRPVVCNPRGHYCIPEASVYVNKCVICSSLTACKSNLGEH